MRGAQTSDKAKNGFKKEIYNNNVPNRLEWVQEPHERSIRSVRFIQRIWFIPPLSCRVLLGLLLGEKVNLGFYFTLESEQIRTLNFNIQILYIYDIILGIHIKKVNQIILARKSYESFHPTWT